MRKSFPLAYLLALMLGILIIDCSSSSKDDAANSSSQANTGNVEPKSDGQQYQAVCTDTQAHGGNDYVLTKWVDSKYKAEIYGKEHERKNKGHVVKYNERAKP
jgi:hypothetical protein